MCESAQVSDSDVGDANVAAASDVLVPDPVNGQVVNRNSDDQKAVSGTKRCPVRSTRGQLPPRDH